jgi:hypothetical protein
MAHWWWFREPHRITSHSVLSRTATVLVLWPGDKGGARIAIVNLEVVVPLSPLKATAETIGHTGMGGMLSALSTESSSYVD